MEYALCRAFEVSRLVSEDLIRIHTKERAIRRCLLPFEIQEMLGLPPLKERYQIPEHEGSQGKHAQFVRGLMRKHDMIPKDGDFNITDFERIHIQDEKIQRLNLDLELTFKGTAPKKRRLVDELSEDKWVD